MSSFSARPHVKVECLSKIFLQILRGKSILYYGCGRTRFYQKLRTLENT